MLWICLGGSSILPIVAVLIRPVRIDEHWLDFAIESIWPAILFLWPCIFGLFGSYLFNRERIENTYKNLLVIPVNRVKLSLVKLLVLFSGIQVFCLYSYLLGLPATLFKVTIHMDEFVHGLGITILVGCLVFAAMLPVVCIAVLSKKSYVIAIAISIIYAFVSFMSIWSDVFSSFVPLVTTIRILDSPKLQVGSTYPLSVSCFVFAVISITSILGIIWASKKQEA